MKWCEEKTWKEYHHSNSSFIWPATGFPNNPKRGIFYIRQQIVPYLGGGECIGNTEAFYQKHSKLEKVKGSRVLVVGAGPSAAKSFWDPSKYDLIVSCNHFFKNSKLKEIDLFMVSLGDEVDLEDTELIDYINGSTTLFCFENIGRPTADLKAFKSKYPEKVFWAHTRYHSKIGAVVRMISLLCQFNPLQIDVVGMDGYVPTAKRSKHLHSFQPSKGPHGTFEGNGDEEITLLKYKQQYLEFWDYVLHDVGKNIKFKNLGHGHPCNLSTEVLTEKLGDRYQDYLYDIEQRNK